jgi:hypothetical protein
MIDQSLPCAHLFVRAQEDLKKTMKRIHLRLLKIKTSMVIFFLFFGISMLEAFRTHNWLKVAFWVGIASMFLLADNLKPHQDE